MAISLREAFGRVFKDELFMPNYTALVVMSFCSGLLYFALYAKNIPYVLPSAVLALVALVFSEGFHLKYFKALISEQNPTMPDWKNMTSYGATGIKYIAASMILGMVFASISFFLIAVLLIFGLMLKMSVQNIILVFTVVMCAAELLVCLCLPAFVYVFTDMNENVTAFLFLNKIWKCFSCNYFTALFLMIILTSLNAILAVLTVMNVRYILLYIIPLMITPLIRFGIDNIIAQAYLADKNYERGSCGEMLLYLLIALTLILGVLYVLFKVGNPAF